MHSVCTARSRLPESFQLIVFALPVQGTLSRLSDRFHGLRRCTSFGVSSVLVKRNTPAGPPGWPL